MKKHGKLLLFILLAACLYVSGCSMREHIDPMAPAPTAVSATPAPGQPQEAIPEESPTPEPKPVSAGEIIHEGGIELERLSSYDQVTEWLEGSLEGGFADRYPSAAFPAPADSIRLASAQADGDLLAMGDGVIYVLADKDLVVLLPDVEAESPLARIRVGLNWTGETGGLAGQEKSPRGIYVRGDRLVVVSDWYGYENGAGVQYSEYTAADIYDISDPAAPVQMISFGQGGSFSQAGIWEDRFYLITEAPVFESDEERTAEELIPRIYTNGGSLLLPADRISVAPDGNGSGFTLLGIYSLTDASRVDCQGILGLGGDIYSADGWFYFTAPRWAEGYSRTLDDGDEYLLAACTDVFGCSVQEPTLSRLGTINGVLNGTIGLSARGEKIYALSSLRESYAVAEPGTEPADRIWESGTAVTALNRSFEVLSVWEDREEGNRIDWAAFLDDSVVLTEETGRSYVIDFSDPSGPVRGDALPEPVRVRSILPWGSDGYMAFYQSEAGRLTLSIRDRNLRELDSRTFGADHSNTLENSACYLTDADANLLGFAADDSYCLYGLDTEWKIFHRLDVFVNDWAWNARAFVDGSHLFVADTKELYVFDLLDLQETEPMVF